MGVAKNPMRKKEKDFRVQNDVVSVYIKVYVNLPESMQTRHSTHDLTCGGNAES